MTRGAAGRSRHGPPAPLGLNGCMVRFPVGFSDFAQLRRAGYHYVDKTGLAAEIIRSSAQVLMLQRPRRFGKTLNLSMLRAWFERSDGGGLDPGGRDPDRSALFAGLTVTTAGDDVAEHFQRHPVIFLTFKDIKHAEWATCHDHVVQELAREVERLRPVWSVAALSARDVQKLEALAREQPTEAELHDALRLLTRALHLGSGQEVVLLVDEYDTPIHSGWMGGYYDKVIELFRNLLSGVLKDNAHLYRGVLTGILRVAKESIFSGLNNVAVHSLLSRPFSRWFGFTEEEVQALCALAGPTADLEGIRRWYNGYQMGAHVVYNPWSVLRYLSAIEDGFLPYWVNTSSDDLLRNLLVRSGLRVHDDLTTLIAGGEIIQPVSEDVGLRDLQHNTNNVWNFLLFSGYLKARDVHVVDGRTVATLAVPNREVLLSYRSVFLKWLELGLGGTSEVDALCRSLLTGDAPGFRARLQRLMLESLSYFDVGGRTPEAVYQAFLVGLLVHLSPTHIVDSNRESGYGRYDVCVRPRQAGHAGAVVELKRIDTEDGDTTETALEAAMTQVHEREYATTLRQAGADPVWQWAAVFDGKRVWVRVERG